MTTEKSTKNYTPHCKCGDWWTGVSRCHCGGCHVTFSSQSAFDAHRRGSAESRKCALPRESGLEPKYMPYGVMWAQPGEREWPGKESE